MLLRPSGVLYVLGALAYAGCGRIGVERLSAERLRLDATVAEPDAPDLDPDDGGLDPDAAALAEPSDAALEVADDADVIDAGSAADAESQVGDASASTDAAVADCRLTVGGASVSYRTGEIGVLEGTHIFSLMQTGMCAGAAGCGFDLGGEVVQTSCDMSTCQMWESVDANNGWFSLRNAKNGACLYMSGTGSGIAAVSWECSGIDRMRWQVACAGNDTWYLVSKLSNKLLEGDGSTGADAGIVQSAESAAMPTGSTQTRWKIASNPMAFDVVMTNAENDTNPVWRYTTSNPGSSWTQPSFNDSSWTAGPAAFGNMARSYTPMRTSWTTNDIWLRRSFSLSALPSSLTVKIFHDEDADIFINGMMVSTLVSWAHGYRAVDVPASVRSSLTIGANSIAVHCHNSAAPQFIDVGLVTYTWR